MSYVQRNRKGYCGHEPKLEEDNMVIKDHIDNLRNCINPRLHAGYICVAGKCKKGTLYSNYSEIPEGAYINNYCNKIPYKSKLDCCFGNYNNELECPDSLYEWSPVCINYMKTAYQTSKHKYHQECASFINRNNDNIY
jgi:hypothetical protein